MNYNRIVRSLDEKEQRFLRNQRAALLRRHGTLGKKAVTAVATYCIIFGVTALLTYLTEGRNLRFILLFWSVIGALIAVPAFIQERRKVSQRLKAYDFALAANKAEELRVQSAKMWEFEEQDDEGACYAFELTSGGVVFVVGQDFYASARFPNTDFSIVEIRDPEGRILEMLIEKRGEKLAPEKRVLAREKEHIQMPDFGSIFDGTLEEVWQKLKNPAKAKNR
jgi:hypothetical protein